METIRNDSLLVFCLASRATQHTAVSRNNITSTRISFTAFHRSSPASSKNYSNWKIARKNCHFFACPITARGGRGRMGDTGASKDFGAFLWGVFWGIDWKSVPRNYLKNIATTDIGSGSRVTTRHFIRNEHIIFEKYDDNTVSSWYVC